MQSSYWESPAINCRSQYVCEIMQFEILPDYDRERISRPYPKTLQWMQNVKVATDPYFDEVHKVLYRFKARQHSKQGSVGEFPS